MNRYSADSLHAIDFDGKLWPINTWYLMPAPDGIRRYAEEAGFWLVQAPLPPVPVEKPKSQFEIDREAFVLWHGGFGPCGHEESCWESFRKGARYARQQMAPEGIV